MAITLARAEQHIDEWTGRFRLFRSRSKWPTGLFHACQMEVAAEILRRGELRCRNDVPNILCDVANQGALWNNPEAHNYARLYFRPRNMFHLKTEGIKRSGDPYRVDPHMSMPVMLVFDFKSVLTLNEAGFLAGNFAHLGQEVLRSNDAFDRLNFAHIYHDSGTSGELGATIREARMSEVVVREALSTAHLSAVVCRTAHDLASLKHLLAGHSVGAPMLVEGETAIFQKKGIYIRELYSDHGAIHLTLAAPESGGMQGVLVRLTSSENTWRAHVDTTRFVAEDLVALSRDTTWTIEIEGCLAYRAPIPWTSGVV
jgi:hypothetical protein